MDADSYIGSCRNQIYWDPNIGCYRTRVPGLQHQSDEIIVRICVWYHKLKTRWKQTSMGVVVGNQLYMDSTVRLLSN